MPGFPVLLRLRVCSNSCPSSWWCYLTTLSCAALFSFCLQSFLALGNFPMSQLFESDGQVLQLQHQSFQWIFKVDFLYDFFYKFLYNFLAVKETLNSLLQHHHSEASILWYSALFMIQLSHPYMTIGKTIALTRWTFVIKVMSLFLNMLSRFVKAFLPRSKRLLISWLQSLLAVILEPREIKSDTVFTFSSSICHEVMEPDTMIFVFLMLSFNPAFSFSSFTLITRLFSSLRHFLPLEWYHLYIWGCWHFSQQYWF